MMDVMGRLIRWCVLILSTKMACAFSSKNCDASTIAALQEFMDGFVETANSALPFVVDARHLDPMQVPFDHYIDLMEQPSVKEVCSTLCEFEVAKCAGVGVHIRNVTLRGLRDLQLNSLHYKKCLDIDNGEKCSSCATSTGDSRQGYDIDWELHSRDAFKVDFELMPTGIVATCKSPLMEKTFNMWSGYINCTTHTSDAVISGNVCGALCAPLSEDKVCIACKQITSTALNLSPVQCKYDRKGGVKVLPNIEELLNRYLMPRLTKKLEEKITERLKKTVDELKLPVPETCPPTPKHFLLHPSPRLRKQPVATDDGSEHASRHAASTMGGAQNSLTPLVQHIVDTLTNAGMELGPLIYNWTRGDVDLQGKGEEERFATEDVESLVVLEE
eukprot:GEMP01047266.1.p1 GENE.GEMP01047266.1~~GEMP01047266.1.p1  ORF type:complete len:388 (+),score=83.42 GEMP01047266.1:24-1187(+)